MSAIFRINISRIYILLYISVDCLSIIKFDCNRES